MDSLALLLLTLLFALMACASIYFLIRQPLNVVAGLVFLCVLLYLFPALCWMHGLESGFEYGFGTTGTDVALDGNLPALAMAFGLTGLLLLGGAWTTLVRRKPVRRPTQAPALGGPLAQDRRAVGSNEVLLLLGIAWIGLILIIQHTSGLSLFELVLPSRKIKADVYGSFYLLYFVIYAPLAIGAALYLRVGRLRTPSVTCFALSILIALGAAQRRNILVVVLFVVALYGTERNWLRSPTGRPAGGGGRTKPKRAKLPARVTMACVATVCLALGPALWWLRNYFTGLADPVQELIMPWHRKGFLELFFGSAGAGFPTFLLVKQWVETDRVQWGISLLATLCVFVPRELWANKPQGAELLLQQRFGLTTMPSTFLLNELYLNAGLFCFPLALLVGRALSGIHHHCAAIGSPCCRIVIAAMFANLITVFKNGLGPFAVNTVFLVGLCWFAMITPGKTYVRTGGWLAGGNVSQTEKRKHHGGTEDTEKIAIW